MEAHLFEIYKYNYNFNTQMLKQERKQQKQENIKQEKAQRQERVPHVKEEQKKASQHTEKQHKSKSKDNKSVPVTKPRLEAMPTITSMLSAPKEERLSLVLRVLPSVMPFISSYINKKEGARVVQLLVKWGDEPTRQQIFDTLRSTWKEMIRGKYSIFVLKQLVR